MKGNQLQLLTDSDDVMQALIRDIQLARHNIEMVFYIWQPGGMADQVAESLMAAARRDIHCRLMLDSAGSVAFFRSPWAAMMRNAGIEVVEALKVNLMRVFLRRMDLRQHRKMVMIDNYIAYTGSMNMVDPRFFKQDAGVGQWVDLMARMEGPVATAMGIVYSCDWEIETGKRILPPPPDVNIMPFEQASGHTIHTIASGPWFSGRSHSPGTINRHLCCARIFNYDHSIFRPQRRSAARHLYRCAARRGCQYYPAP